MKEICYYLAALTYLVHTRLSPESLTWEFVSTARNPLSTPFPNVSLQHQYHCGRALLLNSAIFFKIPPSTPNRLPSNIPLRTLASRSDHGQSTSLLDDHRHRLSHGRRSDDSADSDSWTDTGDLAEQLADEEDPLRKSLADTSLKDDLISGAFKRHPKHNRRVQFKRSVDEHSYHSRSNSCLVDKEAIQIPDVPPRRISRGERCIAAIMPGTGIHGFTGKALIYFTSIFVSLGVFLFGYDQGVMSGIITLFQQSLQSRNRYYGGYSGVGAFISSLVVGRVGDIIGRRKTILYGSMIFFVGGALQTFATNMPMMMLGRVVAGLGVGSLSTIVPVYQWLLDNDHDEEGIVVIANLYGGGDIHNPKARDEYREIKMHVLLQRMEGERTYSEMFRRYKTRVFIAMSAQALAQLNGINVISYYAPYVFESAGWYGHDAIKMTGINGITYLLSTIPPWYIVDRWGRRVILLSGAVAMAISLSLVSYFIYLDVESTPILVVVFVMIYNAAFGYSWGPIPWLYPPEILPLSIRSKGASLSTASNWAFNWLVGEMTPILQEWIKWRLYLLHAFFCVVSFVVVYFIYPETCGVRLEDMDSLFGDASTAIGTPGMRSESGSLVRAGSPVPSLDLGDDHLDGKPTPRQRSESRNSRGRVGEWLSRMVGQTRGSSSSPASGARYTALDQRDD
ncbi:hypothetical protein CIB48_g8795 [Xylaria polymorpha]|nr:hypothetical protein CIB48_g8795 [Xylaria polymorpha]